MTTSHKGPRLPKRCRRCKYYDPVAEAYACGACPIVLRRDAKADAAGQDPNRLEREQVEAMRRIRARGHAAQAAANARWGSRNHLPCPGATLKMMRDHHNPRRTR